MSEKVKIINRLHSLLTLPHASHLNHSVKDRTVTMSSQAQQTLSTGSGAVSSAMQPNNAAADIKPAGKTAEKVKVSLLPTPFALIICMLMVNLALLRLQRRKASPRRMHALFHRQRSAVRMQRLGGEVSELYEGVWI